MSSGRSGAGRFARATSALTLRAQYSFLDAKEGRVAGDVRVREVRRARHTASLGAIAEFERGNVALFANYVGKRRDIDFDSFPARDVTLGAYVLTTLSGEFRLTDAIALTARVENLFDERYVDVFGSATAGISAYGGLRVKWGG